MASITELQADLETLKAARRSGASTITFSSGGASRTVTYRSDRDLTNAIAAIEAEIAALQGGKRVRNVVLRLPANRGW